MMITAKSQLSELLEQVARSLDIPDEMHQKAVHKYEEVGHWLEEQDKAEGRREPSIYPQGSFRLGTVIRPISDKDDYDIDLVSERQILKESTTQKKLKEEAGVHLEALVYYLLQSHRQPPTLTAGRRCWTLDYPDSFHMDILPAIPDTLRRAKGGKQDQTAIEITDRDLREWQPSNPIAYGDWFKGRMLKQFLAKRADLARADLEGKGIVLTESMLKEAAAQVPEYRVKTPLQRAIQILKRHRDFYFQDDKDNRPVSIILTTLAASAYDDKGDLVDALMSMVRGMPDHIKSREENGRRVAWVPNPVNEEENFADRWQDREHPEREKAFRTWLRQVDEDMTLAVKGGGIHKVVNVLSGSMGRSLVEKAAASIGQQALQQRQAGNLKMDSGTGGLGSEGNIKVKEHTFYGVDETKND